MRINRLNIESFGKLEDVSITLDDKITLIHGKNEAGKSTVSSFVKYMLYGFEASKKQSVAENSKKKYTPWQKNACMGEMHFTSADGKKYRAVRKTDKKSTCTIFDQNNMPISEQNAGDLFFEVNESTYKKTAFIGSSNNTFSDDGELARAMENMVYSSDENQDSTAAIKALSEMRKYYLGKAGRSGKIYELENQLHTLMQERDKWQDGHKELLSSEYQLKQTSARLADNKQKLSELLLEKQNLEYKKAKEKKEAIDKAKRTMDDGKAVFEQHYKKMQNGSFVPDEQYLSQLTYTAKELSNAKKNAYEQKQALEKAGESLNNLYGDKEKTNVFEGLSQRGKTAKELLSDIDSIKKNSKKAKKIAIILTCLVITIPIAIFFYVKSAKLKKSLDDVAKQYGAEGIAALEKILSSKDSFGQVENAAKEYVFQCEQRYKQAVDIAEQKSKLLTELCDKAGINSCDLSEYVRTLDMWLKQTAALKQKCREDYVKYNTLVTDVSLDELCELCAKYNGELDIHDEKTLLQKISFYTQAIDALIPKERELEKTAAVLSGTLPKPAEIQSKILSVSQNLEEMKHKHKALVLAIETLEKASGNLKSEAVPQIISKTSELFCAITGGKYKALYTGEDMSLSVLPEGEAQVYDANYLSTGTLDAAYICLRITLCSFLYKEKPTLVFDDAFSHMDDVRLETVMGFLEELSKDYQIIILSCHDREKRLLEGKAKIIDFVI